LDYVISKVRSYSVAEFAEKPLYRVTCGDIGTNPEAVEEYLKTILLLGKTWQCGKATILLLVNDHTDNGLYKFFYLTKQMSSLNSAACETCKEMLWSLVSESFSLSARKITVEREYECSLISKDDRGPDDTNTISEA
jgi:hypothetical protein